MKALVLHADRRQAGPTGDPRTSPASTVWMNPRLSLEEVPAPSVTDPFDVIVRVAWCGVCGSDLHCSEATPDGSVAFGGPARLPVVLGHELTGRVVEVGRMVTNVAPGDLVTAESVWSCWTCDECEAGHLNECRRAELVGLTVNGAIAPFVRVDARHCYPLGALVDCCGRDEALELGALLEPLGVARRGLLRADFRPDDDVVVVGAGPVGLGIVMLASIAGARSVTVFEVIDARVALAEAAGARAFNVRVLAAHPDGLEAAVRDVCGGTGASLAVEAGGTAGAFDVAFAAARNRGRVLVLGRLPAPMPLDTNALLSRSLTVIGSRGHAGMNIFPELIDLMSTGALDPSPLITSRFGLSEAAAAFTHARSGNGGKTLIRVDEMAEASSGKPERQTC